jgi:hypothetical protein
MFDHLAATVLYEMCVEQPTATVRNDIIVLECCGVV